MAKQRFGFINKSILVFMLLLIVAAGLLIMHVKGYINIEPAIEVVKFFLSTAIIIVITSIVLRSTVGHIFNLFQKDLDVEQRILLTKVYTISIYTLGVSVVLYMAGVGLSEITLFLGLIATGIALAVRDIIMSFFIWLIVLTKRPFRIGDVISSAEDTGIVDRIGTFYITLNVRNGHESHIVRVPNKMLLDRNLKNHGKNMITGEMKLPILSPPKDLNTWLKDVRKNMDQETVINLDMDKDLQLIVRYRCEYGIDKKTEILSKLFSKYRKELKDGKP